MKMGVFVSDYKMAGDTLGRLKADGIILVLNGVYHAFLKEGGKPSPVLDKTANLYALSEDIETRGLSAGSIDSRVKVVNYSGLVDLIFSDYEKLAWL